TLSCPGRPVNRNRESLHPLPHPGRALLTDDSPVPTPTPSPRRERKGGEAGVFGMIYAERNVNNHNGVMCGERKKVWRARPLSMTIASTVMIWERTTRSSHGGWR